MADFEVFRLSRWPAQS